MGRITPREFSKEQYTEAKQIRMKKAKPTSQTLEAISASDDAVEEKAVVNRRILPQETDLDKCSSLKCPLCAIADGCYWYALESGAGSCKEVENSQENIKWTEQIKNCSETDSYTYCPSPNTYIDEDYEETIDFHDYDLPFGAFCLLRFSNQNKYEVEIEIEKEVRFAIIIDY